MQVPLVEISCRAFYNGVGVVVSASYRFAITVTTWEESMLRYRYAFSHPETRARTVSPSFCCGLIEPNAPFPPQILWLVRQFRALFGIEETYLAVSPSHIVVLPVPPSSAGSGMSAD